MDLYARRTNAAGGEKTVVCCKHAYGSVVVLAAARALYGVVSAEQHLTRGMLVTSGSFSEGCRSFAHKTSRHKKRIDLIDGERLRELLDRYRVR